jgi:putative sigma-54 modulation protein
MDMYTSIDLVVEKLEKQIEKHKTKIAKRFRAGSFKMDAVPNPVQNEGQIAIDSLDEYPVVKTKRFAVKPMDIQEAIMQMNMINHDFFVFRDADTEEVNVVYRRKDNRYGLIEPGV